MKKVPMIILLLAPYVFLLICIGICMAEKGFTADAIEIDRMDVSGNVSADFVPQYDLRVHFETLWIWASKIIFLEYADPFFSYF